MKKARVEMHLGIDFLSVPIFIKQVVFYSSNCKVGVILLNPEASSS